VLTPLDNLDEEVFLSTVCVVFCVRGLEQPAQAGVRSTEAKRSAESTDPQRSKGHALK